jgi:GT2 family glycosyltransferase
MNESKNTISVVIPTKGRGETMGKTLKSLGLQPVKVHEVVIIDGSPQSMEDHFSDKVFESCAHKPNLIYCHAPEDRGLTAARNRGIRASHGNLIQFMDDDAVLDPEYFRHLLPVFDRPDVGGASGLVIEPMRKVSALKRVFFRFFYVGPFRQIREEITLRQVIGGRSSTPSSLTKTLPVHVLAKTLNFLTGWERLGNW